jgi:hypothetical protein
VNALNQRLVVFHSRKQTVLLYNCFRRPCFRHSARTEGLKLFKVSISPILGLLSFARSSVVSIHPFDLLSEFFYLLGTHWLF